jgi:TonB-linked SusC/RagA family outer membrane protein
MKKKPKNYLLVHFYVGLSKIFKIMKITLLLLLLGLSNIYGFVFSQSMMVDLNLNNVSLIKAFESIESKTNIKFLYRADLIDIEKTINLNVKETTLDELMKELLRDTKISYNILNDNLVVLTPYQQHNVTGTVTDATTGEPLPGVYVVIEGTTTGTVTGNDGIYSLSVPDQNGVLVFSFIGYNTERVIVSGRTIIDLSMKTKVQTLDEVVVVGYGTQKKVNLTGSVATLSPEELTKRPVANIAQMLQGKLAGVEVRQNTGEPGAEGVDIRIRGLNSFGTSTSPIVLVDGFEGSLSSLDPNNIESISVLKDASSAAIYGSRAANGVILVTTKRGKAGTFSLSYHGNFAQHNAASYPELVNDPVEYMEMFNVASANSGAGVSYPQEIIEKYRSGELKGYNWDDAFWKKAFVQNHNLTATGGTEKLRYNFGVNYWDQPGVLHGFNYKQYRVLFNVDSDINKYISFGAGVNFSQGDRKSTFDGQSNEMICWAANAPTYGPRLSDGRYTWSAYSWEVHNANPVVFYENGGAWTKDYNVLSNVYMKVTPLKGLIWETNGGVKYFNSFYKKQVPSVQTYDYYTGEPRNVLGGNDVQLTVNQSYDVLYSLFSTLKYEKSIGDHNFSVLAGGSLETYKYNYLAGFRRGFPNNDLTELNVGGTTAQTTNGTAYEWALGSYFGRINYNFRNKYLFEANARLDGSSRFPSDDRYGFFPSFSVGWRLSEEEFIKNVGWIQNLKVRASWGELGNQAIGNYPYQDLLSLGYDYAFGSSLTSGAVQTSLSNRLIRWETTTITDVGLDLDIKNGLFSLVFDYFNKTTSDILRAGQVMATVGLNGPTINNGEMKNTGFDLTAGHQHNIGELKYGISLNFSHYKNELVKFGAREISGRTIKQQGIPYDSWYLNEWDGIFQSEEEINTSPVHYYAVRPGTIKLKDVNGDNKANLDDRVVIDGRYPKFLYGLNLNLEWRSFDFSAFFQGVQGIKYYVMQWGLEPFSQGSRPPVKWRDAWTEENHSNTLPYLYFADRETSNRQNSTFWLMDGSYFKLKNIQVGYNIPKPIVGKVGMQSARVYVAGDNLFTITDFEGFDPERNPDQTRFGEYPQLRIYSLGIKVEF